MPRQPVVTGERVVELLSQSQTPFVDSERIADYLGVTNQAVRNKHQKLSQHTDLETDTAGQTQVYWLSEESNSTRHKNLGTAFSLEIQYGQDAEERRRNDGLLSLDFGRLDTDCTPDMLRERMAFQYGCGPTERDLDGAYILNQYDRIGSAYFTLSGSPPKGHAIYIKSSGSVYFYTSHLNEYARWRNVTSL